MPAAWETTKKGPADSSCSSLSHTQQKLDINFIIKCTKPSPPTHTYWDFPIRPTHPAIKQPSLLIHPPPHLFLMYFHYGLQLLSLTVNKHFHTLFPKQKLKREGRGEEPWSHSFLIPPHPSKVYIRSEDTASGEGLKSDTGSVSKLPPVDGECSVNSFRRCQLGLSFGAVRFRRWGWKVESSLRVRDCKFAVKGTEWIISSL